VRVPRQSLALGQGAGPQRGQDSGPRSHLPLSGLNFTLPASALFSAQLENKPFGVVVFSSFPNLDGPKAPRADKGKFIPSPCLRRCWNMLLPHILHQGSVGKAQLPQHGLTLTYICPSPLTASSRAPTSQPGHAAALGSVAVALAVPVPASPLLGQPVPMAPAPDHIGTSARPASRESPTARGHTDPSASLWLQPLLTCLPCPPGARGSTGMPPGIR